MNDLTSYNDQFQKVVDIIENAKERAYRKVNEELILMYRDVGEYISKNSEKGCNSKSRTDGTIGACLNRANSVCLNLRSQNVTSNKVEL